MTINHQINIVSANCGKFKFLIFSRILSGTFVYFLIFFLISSKKVETSNIYYNILVIIIFLSLIIDFEILYIYIYIYIKFQRCVCVCVFH